MTLTPAAFFESKNAPHAGCTIETGAQVTRSLLMPYTRRGAHA
jgi:hypothetical protein